jgi:hypothetical protein
MCEAPIIQIEKKKMTLSLYYGWYFVVQIVYDDMLRILLNVATIGSSQVLLELLIFCSHTFVV